MKRSHKSSLHRKVRKVEARRAAKRIMVRRIVDDLFHESPLLREIDRRIAARRAGL